MNKPTILGAALTAALLLTASASPAGSARGAEPVIELVTDGGAICIRLYPDAAPDAVAQVDKLVADGRFDGVTFDYTRPRIELRTSDAAAGLQIPADIDAVSLGIDARRIANRGEAMEVMQEMLLPAYRKALRGGQLSERLETWLGEWFDDYDPAFLIGSSYQQVYEALGYTYTPGLDSRAVTRGSVALVPRRPGVASARLSIALRDRPTRDGQWTVVGEVTAGLDLAERISLRPLATPAHTKPVGYEPGDPVVIDAVHRRCASRAPLQTANQGDIS